MKPEAIHRNAHDEHRLVVVGGGTAGTETAFAARAAGWEGEIILLSDEAHLPYHRPPLSKEMLESGADVPIEPDPLKGRVAFDKKRIEPVLGARVSTVDTTSSAVSTDQGLRIAYSRLVLAIGGRPRHLPHLATDGLRNVHVLRTLDDCARLRSELCFGGSLIVIGAGYIGLEVAASATKLGQRVAVLEMNSRVMGRVTAPVVSRFFEHAHRSRGVDIRTSTAVEELIIDDDRVVAVRTTDGNKVHADNIVVGVGFEPNTELAELAGLDIGTGVQVDGGMATSDPRILATGDNVEFFSNLYGRRTRVESVSNAVEHARRAAMSLVGGHQRPWGVPWFWSHQFGHRLQIAGLSEGYEEVCVDGDPNTDEFSVTYYQDGQVIAVDAINQPAAFSAAKRQLAQRASSEEFRRI